MRGKKITKVVLWGLEAAHRVPGRYKRQKRSFQTILKHFEKKNSNFPQNFHIKIDSQSWSLHILEVGQISRKLPSEQVKSRPS